MFTNVLSSLKSTLRGRESGKDAFVLGNGPSVAQENLAFLRNQVTIGLNASTLLAEKFDFTQKYYCVSDARFLGHPEKRQLATDRLGAGVVRIVRKDIRHLDDENLSTQTYYVPHIKRDGFSENLDVGFYYGCSTTMLAVQLAHHLGCKRIFLLGVDLRYPKESPRFYSELNPQLEDAFTSVQIWNLANAHKALQKKGVELINCSRSSMLRPHLPFRSFSEIAP
jgi:hypothetical protein